jgi:Ran GTPase-activating protein (RanGAP) involved in mRNA processing and transport
MNSTPVNAPRDASISFTPPQGSAPKSPEHIDHAAVYSAEELRAQPNAPMDHNDLDEQGRTAMTSFLYPGILPDNADDVSLLAAVCVKNNLPTALAWLVVKFNLTVLDLHDYDLSLKDLKMLANWLKRLPGPVSLNLSRNNIDAQGAALLAEALKANTLTALDLSNNPLGDQGACALAEGLTLNAGLTALNLSRAGVGSTGATALAEMLSANNTLRSLNLQCNALCDDGTQKLAIALYKNCTLNELNIEGNYVTDGSMPFIAELLKSVATLTSVHLGRNDFNAASLPLLADVLAANPSLKILDLMLIPLDEHAVDRLAEAMEKNTNLTSFELTSNQLGDACEAKLERIRKITSSNGRLPARIASAGIAISCLSELSVPIPPEISRQIASTLGMLDQKGARTLDEVILSEGLINLPDKA